PAGGRGGDGGDVFLRVDASLNTLHHLTGIPLYKAGNGMRGGPKNQAGKQGRDLVLSVPPGTIVRDLQTNKLVADLNRDDERILIAQGGKGGLGNGSYATSVRQSPRYADKGRPGEERRLALELKLIADVGIVGLPNAGKSTLLAAISRAHPKIASYPFTTLTPSLGVVGADPLETFVVADLPGLIEGASKGAGLGDRFLRHVDRTRLILHVVDVSSDAPVPPERAYRVVREELAAFNPRLASKPEVVAANKMDLPGAKGGRRKLARACGGTVAGIAARDHRGVPALVRLLRKALAGRIDKGGPGR
ncbi:MAG TPA: GTPase ObgE, partial [Planctomycetota bacterium]|nr:GTPase ObgE [Planctomycetota bacterium]